MKTRCWKMLNTMENRDSQYIVELDVCSSVIEQVPCKVHECAAWFAEFEEFCSFGHMPPPQQQKNKPNPLFSIEHVQKPVLYKKNKKSLKQEKNVCQTAMCKKKQYTREGHWRAGSGLETVREVGVGSSSPKWRLLLGGGLKT